MLAKFSLAWVQKSPISFASCKLKRKKMKEVCTQTTFSCDFRKSSLIYHQFIFKSLLSRTTIMFVLQYSYTSRLWLVNLWKVHSENIFSNMSEPAATGLKTKQTILGVYYTIIPWKRVQSEKQNSIILEHNPNHFFILSSLIGVQHRQSRSKGLFSILLCNEVVQFSLNWLITSLSTWKLPNNVHN